jgi:hypothetical protein
MTNSAHKNTGRPPMGLRLFLHRLNLPPALDEALRFVSEQTGLARNSLVREAVAEWALARGLIDSAEVPITNYANRKDTT